MMQQIQLQPIPNQSFSVTLDNDFYNISIHLVYNTMCATIFRNNVLIVSGMVLAANTLIIPYAYLATGNFSIITANDTVPDYTQFGITQFLVYASLLELENLNG